MPDFPPVGKRAVEEALKAVGLTPDIINTIKDTHDLVRAVDLNVGPLEGEVDVTQDDKEYLVLDTSNIPKVAGKPHGVAGWIDCSNFAKLADTNPDAKLIIRWYIDGLLYSEDTFSPGDFKTEPILYFLERRARSYHKITITTQNSGASSNNPIKFDYSFALHAGVMPIPP